MSLHDRLTTAEFQALFAEEVAAAGGTVSDTFDDGTHLFTRSVLPQAREVRTADRVQGGVALRADGREVWVHPYVFRLVCRNGAIMAHALETRHVVAADFVTAGEAEAAVREAVRGCCAPEAFTAAADAMRSATEVRADLALNLLPLLSRMPPGAGTPQLQTIMERFFREGDRSRFSLMNAVTSVARDTADPDVRWRLEELGGGVLADRTPTPRPGVRAAEAMLVG
jgi:hypothetical protein